MISGPARSGKTTLLNVLAGVDRASSGSVYVSGIEVTELSEHGLAEYRHQHAGYVTQPAGLLAGYTVRDNVELPLLFRGSSEQERWQRASEALRIVNLYESHSWFVERLTQEQKQRVSIARAIVHRPVILLADEPTLKLAMPQRISIAKLLRRIARFRHVVVASRDPSVIQLAHQVIKLHKEVNGFS